VARSQPDLAPGRKRGVSTRLIIGGITALVLLLVGGPWVYVTYLNDDQPENLSLASTPTEGTSARPTTGPASAAGGSLEGSWTIGPESVVGYRVKETLLGQDTEGVGRTNNVTGELTVEGNAVTAAKFAADMTTVESDKSQRDRQFRGRIMDTETYPAATFVSTAPIDIPADASTGKEFTSKGTGDLTLRGKTKSLTFDVVGKKSGAGFDVTAQIPVVFADFGIPDPSAGPARVGKEGTLEVLLKLVQKA